MGSLGMTELMLIFLVVLLVFGAKRIPEIAKGLGKGIREFKDATTDIKRELTVEENQNRSIQPPRQGATASYSGSSTQQSTPVAAAPQSAPAAPAAAPEPAPAEDARATEHRG